MSVRSRFPITKAGPKLPVRDIQAGSLLPVAEEGLQVTAILQRRFVVTDGACTQFCDAVNAKAAVMTITETEVSRSIVGATSDFYVVVVTPDQERDIGSLPEDAKLAHVKGLAGAAGYSPG